MRKAFLFFASLSLACLAASCGKIKQAQDAMKAVTDAVDSVKGIGSSDAGGKTWDLTEASVRRYYQAVAKLKKAYPSIEFENAATAAITALVAGEDIEKIVPGDGGISFEEYEGVSTAIMNALLAGMGDSLGESLVPQLESSIQVLEKTDMSGFTADQKETLRKTLEEQKGKLAELKAKAESPEYIERKRQMELIAAIKKESGF